MEETRQSEERQTGKEVHSAEGVPGTFEDVLEDLGGLGAFQILALVLILVLEVPAAFVSFLPIFTGSPQSDWNCDDQKVTGEDVCTCNGTLLAPMEHTQSIVAEWNLVCSASWIPDFITSVQMAGMILGNVFAGRWADQYGRRPVFLGCVISMALGNAMSAMSTNAQMYAFSRILCGAGLSAFLSVTAIYSMEFQPPKWRTLGGAVGPWGEGIVALAALAYFIPSWRLLTWATTAPFILIVVIYPLLPESPRWLLQNGKTQEATKVLNFMAKVNGKHRYSQENVQYIIAVETHNQAKNDLTYIDFFRFPELRKRTLLLMLLWAIWSLTNFGIGFNIKNFHGDIYFNVGLLGLTDVIGYPGSLLIASRFGRRVSLAFFMVFSAIFLGLLSVLELVIGLGDQPTLLITFCLLGKLGISGARGCIRTVTGESFPTNIRTMGSCLCGIANSLAAVAAPQLAFLGMSYPSLPYFAFSGITFLGAIISFMLDETQGTALATGLDDLAKPAAVAIEPALARRRSSAVHRSRSLSIYVIDVVEKQTEST